jgi:predicted outer membrane protein/sporulation protein YlmC with PRC-barrel domain
MRLYLIAAVALATSALVPVHSSAQQQRNTNTGNPAAETRSTNDADRQQSSVRPQDFLDQAAVSNMFEIESSRLVQDKSDNGRLQQFARRMVNDHGKAADRMKQAAQQTQGADLSVQDRLDTKHQRKINRLQRMDGKRFDRTYVRMQIEAHQRAVDLFQRFVDSGAQGPLLQFAQQTLPTLREHQQSILEIRDEMFPNMSADRRSGTGAQVQIQRTPPQVRIEQGSPQVTVRQARPNVSVDQSRPEIIVRQPQPTVRIDIPQPEITLRMPAPQVDVSQAQPEVQVQQQQPQVRLQRSDQQAQVQVERDQADVNIQRQQARVDVQRAQGQPSVRYEREDPRVVINRAEGQPKVRVERMAADQGRATDQEDTGRDRAMTDEQSRSASRSNTSQQTARGEATSEERDNAGRRLAASPSGQTEGSAGATDRAQRHPVAVSTLEGMQVLNVRGEDVGEVDAVVRNSTGRNYVVITDGGFLGFGEDKVAFPTDRFWRRGDHLVIRGVTADDLDNLADYRNQATNYAEVDGTIDLRNWQ